MGAPGSSDPPRLRPVEAFPVDIDGQPFLCLRDPEGYAEQPIFLPRAAALLVSRMDGQSTLRDIQADFLRRSGAILPFERLEALVAELDRLHFLDSPDFQTFSEEVARAFRAADVRPAAHAGAAYAESVDELGPQLDALLGASGGPPVEVAAARRPLRGLIAPHIDLHRGGPSYGRAYAALAAEEPFDRFVVFGTAHAWMERRFALTEKHFDTPLGRAATDRDFVRRLARDLSVDYFADELAHRSEHSIEFQALFLRHVTAPRRPFTIVPILVGSFHDLWDQRAGGGPAREIDAMVAALRDTIAETPGRTCVIAGADLAHVGRRFGDADGPTPAYLDEIAARDRELLDLAARGAAEAVLHSVAEDHDRRRVCGYPPIYMALRTLAACSGRLLDYQQWADLEEGAAVTYASMALY